MNTLSDSNSNSANNHLHHRHDAIRSSDHHPKKRRRRGGMMAVMMFAMSSTASNAARRAVQVVARRNSAIGTTTSFVPHSTSSLPSSSSSSSSSISTWSSSWQPTPLPFAIQSSSALHMATANNRNKNTNRSDNRSGSSRSKSSASVAAVASSPASSSKTDHIDAPSKSNNAPKTKKNQSNNNKNNKKKKKKKEANTGRLRLLPPLQPSSEIVSRAYRQTHNEIKDDASIANARRRTQKKGAQTVDALCQKLCAPLKATVQTYKWELRRMHPFEAVVMDLTVRARQKKDGLSLSSLLEEVHEGRKELLALSKDWISKIKSSPTARESYECTEEAKEVLGKVFVDLIDGPWDGVRELQKSLRNVPIVRLDCPAVVLVGAPNVGKSSIVRAISSGTPEVNNYPFTTRGMTLGHVQVFWESDSDVAQGNVAGVSIPSEKQLVQENLMRRGVKTRRMKEREMLEAYSREKQELEKLEESMEEGAGEIVEAAMNYGVIPVTGGVDKDEEHGEEHGSTMEHHPQQQQPPQQQQTQSQPAPPPSITKKIFPISQLCQIMDSPGILRRDPNEIRNEMEELTLAAMSHLPTAVMYVMDLSGGAGDKCSSVEDQLILRRDLRARFPRRPWIDVISKVDLGIVDGARERLVDILEEERKQHGDDGEETYFIELSIKEGDGVEELRQEVMRMLGEVRVVLDAMAAMDERSARAV